MLKLLGVYTNYKRTDFYYRQNKIGNKKEESEILSETYQLVECYLMRVYFKLEHPYVIPDKHFRNKVDRKIVPGSG